MNPSVLIIGYGNPLRGDDGLGWCIARQLQHELDNPQIRILALHQLTPEIAADLSTVDLAIFVDVNAEGGPGTLHVQPIQAETECENYMSHNQTPARLLANAELLFSRRPQAYLFSIAGEQFIYTEYLSPIVELAVPTLKAWIKRLVYQSLHGVLSTAHHNSHDTTFSTSSL